MKARTLSRILSCLVLFASSLLTYSAHPAAAQTEDFSHRYVLFLGGVNSTSSGEGEPINDDFSVIETKLEDQGFNENNFVYFSYGAAYGAAYGSQYCLGWAYPLDTPAKPCKDLSPGSQSQPDLNELSINPLYSKEDTHLPIEQQSQALDWLIGQIVSADNSDQTQIDLVGFSLGGIVASHWAATLAVKPDGSDSPNRKHVRSLVLLNSPVGGFAPFNTLSDCPLFSTETYCWVVPTALSLLFGENIPRQLHMEPLGDNMDPAPGSIVPVLRKAPLVLPVTSIQSTNDYLVNILPLRIGASLACVGESSVPIGQGAQFWPSSNLIRVTLGGRAVTTPLCWNEISDFLLGNHNAALREREGNNSPADRAAQLVSEAIQSPPPMPQPPSFTSPTPTDGSVSGCGWSSQCPTPTSDATPILTADPAIPTMPDSGGGIDWGCLIYGQCRTPASGAIPMPTVDPAAPVHAPGFPGDIDWGCLMYGQCPTPASDTTPIPTPVPPCAATCTPTTATSVPPCAATCTPATATPVPPCAATCTPATATPVPPTATEADEPLDSLPATGNADPTPADVTAAPPVPVDPTVSPAQPAPPESPMPVF